MSDLKQRLVEILTKPQMANLATITENGAPWVRYMMTGADENLTFRSATLVESRKAGHIKVNPEVHISCGFTSMENPGPYVQVAARAVITTDEAERHAHWNPGLKHYFEGPDDPRYAVIVMTPYRIELWSFGAAPEVWEAP